MHTGFSVFLERDEKLERAEDHFIRQGITIPEVTSLKHKGIRAIVSIAEQDLSAFLGDAENPAHTEWERNSKKFKQKYRLGVSTLDFDVSRKPIQIKLEGGKLLLYKENAVQIEVLSGDFSLTVNGFDPNRDLRVKTIP